MAGAGYKLFNTGDVLTAAQVNTYLQEQVVMVFNDATARTTALSGVLAEGMVSYLKSTDAVEIYNGSAWVGIAADQTPLTTKGDLFTYSTTDARLGVGNNGESLLADSSATTGLRWTATPSASNPVLNSSFQVWQRGTSFTATTSYGADRWYQVFDSGIAATYSRQNTNDTTNLPNIQYCMRVQRDSGNTGASPKQITLSQSLESANSIPLAGKTVTYSFYARAGANYSPTSSILVATLFSGTGTDQNVMAGFTGNASVASTNATLTTTWQRFSVTGTVATTAKQLAVYFVATPTGTAGANDYFEVTGVQLDIGSVALPFRTYSATLAGELAACQRYYARYNNSAANGDYMFGMGTGTTSTSVLVTLKTPTTMRIAPTSIDYSTLAIQDGANAKIAATSVAFNNSTPDSVTMVVTVASGVTTYRPYFFHQNGSSTAYVGFNAEL